VGSRPGPGETPRSGVGRWPAARRRPGDAIAGVDRPLGSVAVGSSVDTPSLRLPDPECRYSDRRSVDTRDRRLDPVRRYAGGRAAASTGRGPSLVTGIETGMDRAVSVRVRARTLRHFRHLSARVREPFYPQEAIRPPLRTAGAAHTLTTLTHSARTRARPGGDRQRGRGPGALGKNKMLLYYLLYWND
jgi:hypothetical protein